MSYTWEVTFKPDDSIEIKAQPNTPGQLRVEFAPADGEDFTTQTLGGGGTRVTFYGKLKIKSIPGGSANGSYDIPNINRSSS